MFSRKKSLAICLLPLGLFFILWWFLSLNVEKSIQQIFIDIQAPIYDVVLDVHNASQNLKKNLLSKKELISGYENLMRMNLYLQLCIDDLSSSPIHEIPNKHTVLENFNDRFRFIYANVVRRDLVNWTNELVINKGINDGVNVGDGVISAHNVVGRIKKVYNKLSVVELLSSRTFRISVCLENDDFPIIYHGTGVANFFQYSGIAENIITDLSDFLKKSNCQKLRLVSSYLSGIFPGGLTVGYITHLDDVQGGMFTKARVSLDADFINRLHEVVVLSKIESEL